MRLLRLKARKPAIKRRHILWLLVILGLLAPFVASFMPLRQAESEEPDLTELMAEAAMYANQSLHGLTRVLDLLSPRIDDPQGLAVSAYKVSKMLEAESRKVADSGFSGLIKRALLSYSNMSMASAYTFPLLDKLHNVLLNLSKALGLVEECKIDEALSLYESLQDEVDAIKQNLTRAFEYSAATNPDSLLSLEHKDIALNHTKKLREALSVLDEVTKFFSIVEQYEDSLNKLCSNKSIPRNESERIARSLLGVNPQRAGPLAYNEASAARSILMKLGSYTGLESWGQHGGSKGSQGAGAGTGQQRGGQSHVPSEGAGYRAPPSDD